MAANPLLEVPVLSEALARVETSLRESVRTDDAFLTEIASHLIVAGGKRIRPVLAAAAAASVHGHATDEVIWGGVSVELVHLGSLYHDDVMDEAEMRRQVSSVNARWGNLKAILAGDFLLARASEIAASLGVEVAGLLANTIGRLCQGQIGELRATFDPTRTEDAYLSSIDGKTASLFSSSCRIGGIVGGLDRDTIDRLTRYGTALGMVFQIVDDVLDVTATEAQLGKPAGHDLVEGVYSLPVLRTLAVGDSAAAELRDLLGSPISGAELDKALAIVRSGPGIASAVATARGYADEAAALAGTLGDNEVVAAMGAVGHHLIDSLP